MIEVSIITFTLITIGSFVMGVNVGIALARNIYNKK